MVSSCSTRLRGEQKAQYRDQGFCFPIRVFDESEALELCTRFHAYFSANWDQIKTLPARGHNSVLLETHTLLNWVHRIVSHPQVLDAVESILGPNLLVWSSAWFPKMPGDKKYISWHQDATYGVTPTECHDCVDCHVRKQSREWLHASRSGDPSWPAFASGRDLCLE